MDLLVQARKDVQTITQGEFSTDITLEDLDSNSAVVKGLATKHSLTISIETGAPVNSKNTHVSISEQVLIDAGFITRDPATNEIKMTKWKVTYIDSAGISAKYLVDETKPDETLGLIVMILGDSNV